MLQNTIIKGYMQAFDLLYDNVKDIDSLLQGGQICFVLCSNGMPSETSVDVELQERVVIHMLKRDARIRGIRNLNLIDKINDIESLVALGAEFEFIYDFISTVMSSHFESTDQALKNFKESIASINAGELCYQQIKECLKLSTKLTCLLFDNLLTGQGRSYDIDDEKKTEVINILSETLLKTAKQLEHREAIQELNRIIGMHLFVTGLEHFNNDIKGKMRQVLYYLIDANPNDQNVARVTLQAYNQLMGSNSIIIDYQDLLAQHSQAAFSKAKRLIIRDQCEAFFEKHDELTANVRPIQNNQEQPKQAICIDYARYHSVCGLLFNTNVMHARLAAKENYARLSRGDHAVLESIVLMAIYRFPVKNQSERSLLNELNNHIIKANNFNSILKLLIDFCEKSKSSMLGLILLTKIFHHPGFNAWLVDGHPHKLNMISTTYINNNSELVSHEYGKLLLSQLRIRLESYQGGLDEKSKCIIS